MYEEIYTEAKEVMQILLEHIYITINSNYCNSMQHTI